MSYQGDKTPNLLATEPDHLIEPQGSVLRPVEVFLEIPGTQSYFPKGLGITEYCFTRSRGSPLEKSWARGASPRATAFSPSPHPSPTRGEGASKSLTPVFGRFFRRGCLSRSGHGSLYHGGGAFKRGNRSPESGKREAVRSGECGVRSAKKRTRKPEPGTRKGDGEMARCQKGRGSPAAASPASRGFAALIPGLWWRVAA